MPYCRKCGRRIETEDELCENCRNAELIFGEAPFSEKPVDRGNRMDGFPKALASIILGVAAIVIAVVNMALIGIVLAGGGVGSAIGLGVFGILLSLSGIVVSIIFGVKSIVKFVDSTRRGKIKPIATLVCGICGCVASAIAVIYVIVTIPIIAIL